MKLTARARLTLTAVLCLIPLVALLIIWLLGSVHPQVVQHTLAGLPVAVIGGLLAGAAAERFLNRGAGVIHTLLGLALTGGFGLLTLGYLYLIHIRGPMSSIGTVPRAVEQMTLFVAFLLAQAAGMLLAPLALPTKEASG